MSAYAEWLRRVPNPLTARSGVIAASEALADADDVIWRVKNAYSGTVPPPPWPAHPALVAARERVETIYDGMGAIEDRAPDVRLADKLRAALVREAETLYRESAVLAREGLAPSSPIALAKALPNLTGLVVLGVLYLALRDS